MLCPPLLVVELSALFFSGMVISETANSFLVKALTGVIAIMIGLIPCALSVFAFMVSTRARAAAIAMPKRTRALATTAVIIAGFVAAIVLLWQVYLALMVSGFCSLEGC